MDFLFELRTACRRRQHEWPNAHRFSLEFYALEFVSEAGELGNEIKKVARERLGGGGSVTTLPKLAAEVADVMITLANVLNALDECGYDVDIVRATRDKFNERSEERGFKARL